MKPAEASRDGQSIEGGGKINRNSNYGLLMESVKEVVENPGEVIGNPREAAGWIGTRWEFGSIERETTNPTTGATQKRTKFIVTEYLGNVNEGDEDEAPKAKASKAKSSSGIPEGIDTELWDALVLLAADYDDHDEFAEEALDMEEVQGNSAAQRAVMLTGANSVWAAK